MRPRNLHGCEEGYDGWQASGRGTVESSSHLLLLVVLMLLLLLK
jgi:hypothetical protein